MFCKLDHNTLRLGHPRLAMLGVGLGVAACLVVALGDPANARQAGDNPPPGLLAKIQIAT